MTKLDSKLYKLADPRNQYPQPPFDKQPQDAPGLTEKMNPRPDHGEDSYIGTGRLEGRKALITGGDSGIGRAVAIAYAREGAVVTINYLGEEERDAQSLKELIEAEGGTVNLMPGDLKDKGFCRALVKEAEAAMNGLDVLVINAGKQVMQDSIHDITDEQFDDTMKTNIYAMFYLSQEAVKRMPPGASIINVTSVLGYEPVPGLLDYSMTKFAIRGFTQGLAKQAAEKGIRVNGIAPGPFWTPLQPSGGQSQENLTEFGKQTPIGRPGQPVECAPAFVLLASQESSYITGETISITGGIITS
jgi:NAD(P)-dependent dehydrogenase (short-subunit alcohol dehydrogenase family)